jgi:hypothetical protein
MGFFAKDGPGFLKRNIIAVTDLDRIFYDDGIVFIEFLLNADGHDREFRARDIALTRADDYYDGPSGTDIDFGTGVNYANSGRHTKEEFRLEFVDGEFNFFRTDGTPFAGFEIF